MSVFQESDPSLPPRVLTRQSLFEAQAINRFEQACFCSQ